MGQVPKRRRWAIVAGIVVGALALAGWVIIEREPFRHEALSFETPESCPGGASKAPRRKQFISQWAGEDLVVRANICANCAAKIEDVSAQVLGNFILMRISAPTRGHLAACDCEHSTNIRISSLPKRDYQIVRTDSLLPEPGFCE